MKRLLALLAALTMLLALAGCGGENTGDTQEHSTQAEETLPESDAGNEAEESQEEAESGTEDALAEETLPSDADSASQENSQNAPAETGMTLSRTDFTLFQAGSTYKLTASGTKEACTYTSSDPKVATVGKDGTVIAVAPGKATITVTSGKETRTCVVRCDWQTAEKPADKPADKPASTSVDLTAFYNSTIANHEFQTLQAFTGDVLDTYYPGMSDISTKQCLIMGTMMSMNNGEFCLVEVTNSADVATVKQILQDRVDYMAEAGAWYPEPTELWTNSSRVVSNGNYVMMVVHKDCDQIVDDFNALFQ